MPGSWLLLMSCTSASAAPAERPASWLEPAQGGGCQVMIAPPQLSPRSCAQCTTYREAQPAIARGGGYPGQHRCSAGYWPREVFREEVK
jgi:hypothetical protein